MKNHWLFLLLSISSSAFWVGIHTLRYSQLPFIYYLSMFFETMIFLLAVGTLYETFREDRKK